MKKEERLNIIREIIKTQEVSTQEELTAILRNKGYITTQATVSRDINQLELIKVPGISKKYKYALRQVSDVSNKFANIFKQSVLSIESSLNIIVIKTYEGSASGAAFFLDNLQLADIIGTISGDDTIFIVAKSIEAVPSVIRKLKEYL